MNTIKTIYTYEVRGWMKYAEPDIFAAGRDPAGATSYAGPERFVAPTLEELIDHLRAFVPFQTDDVDSVVLNACDQTGRVDINGMETADGNEPLRGEIDAWKQGRLTLYSVTYTFQVEACARHAVDLSGMKKGVL